VTVDVRAVVGAPGGLGWAAADELVADTSRPAMYVIHPGSSATLPAQ
jgi:hypothetical protein